MVTGDDTTPSDDVDAITPKPHPDTGPDDFDDQPTPPQQIPVPDEAEKNKNHEEEKTALILGIVLGSLAIWFLRRKIIFSG